LAALMQFLKKSNYHAVSTCGKYYICRSNAAVGGAYTASRNGSPDVLLGTRRFSSDGEQGDAYRDAVALCVEDERRGE
jgi:hypothetical protein